MRKLYREYVTSVFDTSLQMHGDRPEAVRWTAKGQLARFECLLEIDSNINGKKVLDYGCGKGDLLQFLKNRNIPVQYTGFDINKQMISLAKQKYPEARFRVCDIEHDVIEEKFDYIFLCGVFNLNVDGLVETIENVLVKLFSRCTIALAFNALSAHEPRKANELHYASPEGMLEFAVKNLSPHVSLVHDRVPYDFTLFVRHNVKEQI